MVGLDGEHLPRLRKVDLVPRSVHELTAAKEASCIELVRPCCFSAWL